jgi:hypothetical protein
VANGLAVASGLARVGLRSSPKKAQLHCLSQKHGNPVQGRFAAQRGQARSPQEWVMVLTTALTVSRHTLPRLSGLAVGILVPAETLQ